MAKQLLTPLQFIARMNFSLKNYGFELLNLTGKVGKIELISTFKPGLHIVVMVVSTIANMFLTLFQAVLTHANTLIATSQA